MANDPVLQPIKIGPHTAQNRFAINAMECCDADAEGNPTEKTLRRYKNLFEGGAGMIDLEAITVQYESRGRQFQLSVMPRNAKALTKFVAELRKVIWPTRNELVTYTIVSIVFVSAMVAIVSLFDFVFTKAVLAIFG